MARWREYWLLAALARCDSRLGLAILAACSESGLQVGLVSFGCQLTAVMKGVVAIARAMASSVQVVAVVALLTRVQTISIAVAAVHRQ